MHAPIVLVASDGTFADVAAYAGVSDLLFRRKFVLAGDRFQSTLDRPGLVTFESEIKPLEHAYVYVAPTASAAVASAEGRYVVENVPPGRRRFTAWHPEKGILDREIDVPTGGATFDVVFPAK